MILLIDNYDSFTFNLYQLIGKLGYVCKVIRNDELSLQQIRDLKPTHIVLSPGPGRPEEAGITLDVIRELQGEVPILGVCLGHQAIGQVFGAKVILAPTAEHGKQSMVTHQQQGVFAGIASPLLAARYHSLMLDQKTLPECLEVTSSTEAGVIMGVRHKFMNIEGVQFHPESVATEYGSAIVQNFLARVA